jgi:hypothetical protein
MVCTDMTTEFFECVDGRRGEARPPQADGARPVVNLVQFEEAYGANGYPGLVTELRNGFDDLHSSSSFLDPYLSANRNVSK